MLVFISGPYRGDVEANLEAAFNAANEVMEAGHTPVVPHLYHYINKQHPKPEEIWMAHDLMILKSCDCLLSIGYSSGSDLEYEYAKLLGKPVFDDIEELKEWEE